MAVLRLVAVAMVVFAMATFPLVSSESVLTLGGAPAYASGATGAASADAIRSPAADNDNDGDFEGLEEESGRVDVRPRFGAGGPRGPAAGACSTPGRENAFTSSDGRIAVRVFANMPRSLRFSVRAIDPASVTGLPGRLVDRLVFELLAEDCSGGGVETLPVEVNLGIHYTDAEASGLNEQNITIYLRDASGGNWGRVEKQAPDPPANYVSATVMRMGYYAVTERP